MTLLHLTRKLVEEEVVGEEADLEVEEVQEVVLVVVEVVAEETALDLLPGGAEVETEVPLIVVQEIFQTNGNMICMMELVVVVVVQVDVEVNQKDLQRDLIYKFRTLILELQSRMSESFSLNLGS